MKISKLKAFLGAIVVGAVSLAFVYAGGGDRVQGRAHGQAVEADAPRIAWYATLESGLAEAQRSNRPILFSSAAPQCLGVSGIW